MNRIGRIRNERVLGQYMVEFGMTFGIFVFILTAAVNLILVGYNYDTAQRAAWEAARKAVVGGTNGQITEIIYNEFVEKFFSSMLLVSKINFDPTKFIVPNEHIFRVRGKEIEINMDFDFGLSLGFMGDVYSTLPISSRLTVVDKNDEDVDGYVDSLEPTYIGLPLFANDHRNNGISDSSDSDIDGDNVPNGVDTGTISCFMPGTVSITMPYHPAYGLAGARVLSDGQFATRMITNLSSGDTKLEPWPVVARRFPCDYYNGVKKTISFQVDLSYDRDNDGWSDKWDVAPTDATRH